MELLLKHLSRGYSIRLQNVLWTKQGRKTEKKIKKEEPEKDVKPKIFTSFTSREWVRGSNETAEVFKCNNTLRQTLMHVKTTVPKERRQGMVYEVLCKECRSVYIGETGWSLQERIKTWICSKETWHKQWNICTFLVEEQCSRLVRS